MVEQGKWDQYRVGMGGSRFLNRLAMGQRRSLEARLEGGESRRLWGLFKQNISGKENHQYKPLAYLQLCNFPVFKTNKQTIL